jgi:RNA polymerase sigma-70 factor (ECF subfamily)
LTITPLTFVGDDTALLRALRAGHPGAAAAFYDRHAAHVHRTLHVALGPDADLRDLLAEVFVRALDRIGDLRDTAKARSWLTTIAVFVARAQIRARSRQSRSGRSQPAQLRTLEQPAREARWALHEIYEVIDQLPVDERMAFVLCFVDGIAQSEAAGACQISLATLKRRLLRAERRFLDVVRGRPLLDHWLEKGERWGALRQR